MKAKHGARNHLPPHVQLQISPSQRKQEPYISGIWSCFQNETQLIINKTPNTHETELFNDLKSDFQLSTGWQSPRTNPCIKQGIDCKSNQGILATGYCQEFLAALGRIPHLSPASAPVGSWGYELQQTPFQTSPQSDLAERWKLGFPHPGLCLRWQTANSLLSPGWARQTLLSYAGTAAGLRWAGKHPGTPR